MMTRLDTFPSYVHLGNSCFFFRTPFDFLVFPICLVYNSLWYMGIYFYSAPPAVAMQTGATQGRKCASSMHHTCNAKQSSHCDFPPFALLASRFSSHRSQPASARSSSTTRSRTRNARTMGSSRAQPSNPELRSTPVKTNQATAVSAPVALPTTTCLGVW